MARNREAVTRTLGFSFGTGRQPYTGEQLRALRKERGVGRPPKVMRDPTPAYWGRALRMDQVKRMYNKWVDSL